MNLSDIQVRLLEKTEELTLYTLQQQQTILAQQQQLAELLARVKTVEGAVGLTPSPEK